MDDNQFPVTTPVKSDSNTIAALTWVGSIFFGFIPALIVFLLKKDDPFVLEHAKEALNWSITVMIGYAISAVLTVILVGFLGIFLLGLANVVFCIIAAITASKGEAYRLPYVFRLIK
ncbi:MAG: hypothetical protein RL571_3042 [Pseudomonadota bacterium]|jgi:uncharacterized Tic20 family protein